MISIIVAVAHQNVIGKNNDFPWYLSNDLRRFKALTTGHKIIMGRKTYDHLITRTKGKLLPDRTSIVVTRDRNFVALPGARVVYSLPEAFELIAPNENVFVIGGAQIYKQALPYADRIYLTEVDADIEGDAFFPLLPDDEWHEIDREAHTKDEKHDYNYAFVTLERTSDS